jgi:carbonic anhydrase/acetyltransferase-like protein (isoleucine patch superfamily)
LPLFSFEGKAPVVHPTAFVAPTATIVGDVTIEENASVWYGAVVRGDYSPVVIRAGANVQDGSVIHAAPGEGCEIGAGATVAHNCVIHGAKIGEEAMIANGSVVLDGAVIGARTMIAGGSLVRAGQEIPDEVMAAGSPAVVKGPTAGTPSEFWVKVNPQAYRELAQRHRAGVEPVDG